MRALLPSQAERGAELAVTRQLVSVLRRQGKQTEATALLRDGIPLLGNEGYPLGCGECLCSGIDRGLRDSAREYHRKHPDRISLEP